MKYVQPVGEAEGAPLLSEVTAALGRLCPAGSSCAFPSQPSFTDPTLTTSPPVFIQAVHFTELQDVVR